MTAKEASDREEAARLWINGLEAVQEKIGVKAVYDLSATPFYLRGSGYPEGTLFPWVVSDFSLIDAIESGIVKIPRVPVSDNAMTGDYPTYRDLWYRIRDGLPRKGRGTGGRLRPAAAAGRNWKAALQSLYGHYDKQYRGVGAGRRGPGQRPHAAGVHRRLQQHQRQQAGFRLHRRLRNRNAAPRRRRRRRHRQAAGLQQREDDALAAPAQHDPGGQRAARIRRGHVRRLQEARQAPDRGVQGRVPRAASPAATPRT